MRAFLRELTVPAIVLVGTALFWFHVQEAPSVARRVPTGVIIFITIMMAIVIARAFFEYRHTLLHPGEREADRIKAGASISQWVHEWGQRMAFVALAIGYFFSFTLLGFTLSNFLFLCLALPLAGFARYKSLPKAAWQTGSIAVATSVIFHFLAELMEFNVPVGPFGF